MIPFLRSSRKCKLNYKDKNMVAWGQWGRKYDYKATGEDVGGLWGIKQNAIFIVVALSCVYTYVKNHQ